MRGLMVGAPLSTLNQNLGNTYENTQYMTLKRDIEIAERDKDVLETQLKDLQMQLIHLGVNCCRRE